MTTTLDRATAAYRAFTLDACAARAERLQAFARAIGERDALARRVWELDPLALRAVVATLLHHEPALRADRATLTEYAAHALRYCAWGCAADSPWPYRARYDVLPFSFARALDHAVAAVLAASEGA